MDKHSGYCVIIVNKVHYPVKFGMGAWAIIAQERGKPMEELFTGLSETEFIAWITYGGIKHAALAGYTKNKPPENIHYIYELMDNLTDKQMRLLGKTFAQSKVIGRTMKELIDAAAGDDKKKAKAPALKK